MNSVECEFVLKERHKVLHWKREMDRQNHIQCPHDNAATKQARGW